MSESEFVVCQTAKADENSPEKQIVEQIMSPARNCFRLRSPCAVHNDFQEQLLEQTKLICEPSVAELFLCKQCPSVFIIASTGAIIPLTKNSEKVSFQAAAVDMHLMTHTTVEKNCLAVLRKCLNGTTV